jgi:hypothetical protein
MTRYTDMLTSNASMRVPDTGVSADQTATDADCILLAQRYCHCYTQVPPPLALGW